MPTSAALPMIAMAALRRNQRLVTAMRRGSMKPSPFVLSPTMRDSRRRARF
jgi:hypothetical protein